MISVSNYSIVSITETHDTNLTLRVGKEKTWDTAYSTPTTGIHGTATMASLGIFARVAETNVSAIETTWEGQDLMVITAYFPNEEKGTKATIRAVDKILKVNQTKRIILTGDSTPVTLPSFRRSVHCMVTERDRVIWLDDLDIKV